MSIFFRFRNWAASFRSGRAALESAREREVGACELAREAAPAPLVAQETLESPPAEATARGEEAIQKIRQGFEDLSRLISSIGDNISDQASASRGIRDQMEALPMVLEESRRGNRASEEMLGLLNQEVSESGLRQRESLQILRVLPVALQAVQENELASYKVLSGIREDLAKRAEFEASLGESFKRFDETLKSLHAAALAQLGQVKSFGRFQRDLAAEFVKTQRKTVQAFELGQERGVEELRAGQAEAAQILARAGARAWKGLAWGAGAAAAAAVLAMVVVFAVWTRAVGDLESGIRAAGTSAVSSHDSSKEQLPHARGK